MKKTNLLILILLVIIIIAVLISKKSNRNKVLVPIHSPTVAVVIKTAQPNPFYKIASSSVLGSYITDAKGMTLYVYKKDTNNVSNCKGICSLIWPAFQASASAKNLPSGLGIIKRPDNHLLQFTWKNMPLYHFSGDKKPGDISGQGFDNLWHVVSP